MQEWRPPPDVVAKSFAPPRASRASVNKLEGKNGLDSEVNGGANWRLIGCTKREREREGDDGEGGVAEW